MRDTTQGLHATHVNLTRAHGERLMYRARHSHREVHRAAPCLAPRTRAMGVRVFGCVLLEFACLDRVCVSIVERPVNRRRSQGRQRVRLLRRVGERGAPGAAGGAPHVGHDARHRAGGPQRRGGVHARVCVCACACLGERRVDTLFFFPSFLPLLSFFFKINNYQVFFFFFLAASANVANPPLYFRSSQPPVGGSGATRARTLRTGDYTRAGVHAA